MSRNTYCSWVLYWCFGTLRLIAAGGADSTLADLQEIKTSFYGFHRIGMSICRGDTEPDLPIFYLILIFPFLPHLHFCLLHLSSPPHTLSRAVMGLDRESDVVHIETRIAKGRECCTPVRRCSKTHRTPCFSFRARSRESSVVQIGPWSLVKQNRCLLTKTESFSGLMDVSSL